MLMFSIRGYVNKVKTPANEVASKGQILLRLLEVTSECRCFLTDQKLCTGKAFREANRESFLWERSEK